MAAAPHPVRSCRNRLRYRHTDSEEKSIPRLRRNPWIWSALISLTVLLGLGSRRFGESLPGFVADYAGDTLWALVAFLGIGLVMPRASTWRVAALAMSFSTMIEVSQLYHAPWIDSIRGKTLCGLVLGHGFLWSDLACYAVGVGLGIVIEGVGLQDQRASGT